MTNTTSFRGKLILGGILLTLCGILLPVEVLGIEQNISDTQSNDISTSVLLEDYQELGTGFTGTIETVKVYLSTVGSVCVRIGLYCFDELPYDGDFNPACSWQSTGADALLEWIPHTKTEHTLTLSTPLVLQADKYYALTFSCYSGCSNNVYLWGSSVDIYEEGAYIEGGNVVDAYFRIETMNPPGPSINITEPADESEITSAFEMEIEFDYVEGFDRVMILFEDWDASSTCPAYDSEEYTEEYLKWFNYQSFPYFSDFFTTSTGTTTIKVSDLATGIYNCVRCYFVKEETGEITEELCPDFNISVLTYIPPEDFPIYYLPITSWPEYYAEHSERYTTSTPLFTKMAEVFEPIIIWIGNIAINFQPYFDPDTAKKRGEEMGKAIPIARGYLENIDNFFGDLPLSIIFIFYIITALVVFVYRLIKGILTIIVP